MVFLPPERIIKGVLFIPGASHFLQHRLLGVAAITRAERVSCPPRTPNCLLGEPKLGVRLPFVRPTSWPPESEAAAPCARKTTTRSRTSRPRHTTSPTPTTRTPRLPRSR